MAANYPSAPAHQAPSSSGDSAPDPCNLIVNYIPTPVTDAELYAMFAQYGELVSARIILDRSTGHPKGYGFVKFKDVEKATMAMNSMNGFQIHGKRLKVTHARGYQSSSIDAYTASRMQPAPAPAQPAVAQSQPAPVPVQLAMPQAPLVTVVIGSDGRPVPVAGMAPVTLGTTFAPAAPPPQQPMGDGAPVVYSGPSFDLPSNASPYNSHQQHSNPPSMEGRAPNVPPQPSAGGPAMAPVPVMVRLPAAGAGPNGGLPPVPGAGSGMNPSALPGQPMQYAGAPPTV